MVYIHKSLNDYNCTQTSSTLTYIPFSAYVLYYACEDTNAMGMMKIRNKAPRAGFKTRLIVTPSLVY